MEYIEWNNIDHKKHSGKAKTLCPKCSHNRTNKKDKCLSVNYDKGLAKCHYCDAISVRDYVKHELKESYKLPEQTWKNYTNISDSFIKYIEGRKISQHIVKELGWTEEGGKIVFNYFEGDTLINKKYRTLDKKFSQTKDAKSIFYNINSIIGADEAVIVEGEFDVAAFYEVGVKNVISVPNGANDNDNYWQNSERYLKDINSFIIAVDNDEKGILLRDKIAQRLGRYRCKYIEFVGKDANDDLINGSLKESYNNSLRFPVSGTFTVDDLRDRIMELYNNGRPETIYPKAKEFGNLKNIFSVMRGQLTVITGIPSHGKSNFNDWYVLNLIKDYNMKASWFSPEHYPLEQFQTNLMSKIIGKDFYANYEDAERITKSDAERYFKWANERIYLTDCEGGEEPTWDWLLNKFKEQMYSYGIDIFIIDAFNKVILSNGNNLSEINKVLARITSFARVNNVIVFLVAHPTKMRKKENGEYEMPSLYDVSGSADFRNQTHNGYTVYRYFEDLLTGIEGETIFKNTKTKWFHQGIIGEEERFKYNKQNGRYHANSYFPNNESLIDLKDKQVTISDDVFNVVEDIGIPF